ncbi:MAG: hypothetical protein U0271_13500 [Polyangiaceae bacterium]
MSGRSAQLAGIGGVAVAAVLVAGCRVSEDDLHRWETTQRGPEKIQAVLKHNKYEMPLRVEAAVSLIRMKARGGRFVGIDMLVDTLSEIPGPERDKILDGLVPVLVRELEKDPPIAQSGQPAPPDPSFPYKDAAYAIMTYENEGAGKKVLLTDEKLRATLRSTLIAWAMRDFDRRLENRTQKYGMEQLLTFLGEDGVAGLPEKVTRDSKNLDRIAKLIKELASSATREAASIKYVEVAKWILSQDWVDLYKPQLEAANQRSKLEPTPEQFQQQLENYQDEEFQRLLGHLKEVGGKAAVDFCLEVAGDLKQGKDDREKGRLKDRRLYALNALELKLDPKNADHLKRIFDIATSDSPPEVLDLALARIGEMPRDQVIGKLYETFTKSEKWKMRQVVGRIILRMSKLENLDEFMSKLPEKEAKGFSMPEALTFGALFAGLREGDVRKALAKYLPESTPVAQRVTALTFYYHWGTPDDVKSTLAPLEADKVVMPVCDTDADCKWVCYVATDPKKPEEKGPKDIKTFGDYVKDCIEPAVAEREEARKAAEAKAAGDKK